MSWVRVRNKSVVQSSPVLFLFGFCLFVCLYFDIFLIYFFIIIIFFFFFFFFLVLFLLLLFFFFFFFFFFWGGDLFICYLFKNVYIDIVFLISYLTIPPTQNINRLVGVRQMVT